MHSTKDEMKKKKNSTDNNNIVVSGGGAVQNNSEHAVVANHNGSADQNPYHQKMSLPSTPTYVITPTSTPRERTRSSQDSTDQYIVVDAEEFVSISWSKTFVDSFIVLFFIPL